MGVRRIDLNKDPFRSTYQAQEALNLCGGICGGRQVDLVTSPVARLAELPSAMSAESAAPIQITLVIGAELLSTVLSALVFAGSAFLSTKCRSSPRQEDASSWVETETDDEIDEEEEREWYIRRRLENRLSFRNLTGDATTADNEVTSRQNSCSDFSPKNSNWHHFENHNSTKGLDRSVGVEGNPASRKLEFLTSLDGEQVRSRHSAVGKDLIEVQSDGGDEEMSVASADHFVWTQAKYSPRSAKRVVPAKPDQQLDSFRLDDSADGLQVDGPGTLSELVADGEAATALPPRTVPLPPLARRTLSAPLPTVSDSCARARRVRNDYNARIMPNMVGFSGSAPVTDLFQSTDSLFFDRLF